jgi:hypothetical protein
MGGVAYLDARILQQHSEWVVYGVCYGSLPCMDLRRLYRSLVNGSSFSSMCLLSSI